MNSSNSFRFDDFVVNSLGIIKADFQNLGILHDILVLMRIASFNVPKLLGLEILDLPILYNRDVTRPPKCLISKDISS